MKAGDQGFGGVSGQQLAAMAQAAWGQMDGPPAAPAR